MDQRSGRKQMRKRAWGQREVPWILFFAIFTCALIIAPGFHGEAAAAVCASCHADGRTGTPPATPTHIQMGLVKAPGAVRTGPAVTPTPAIPSASATSKSVSASPSAPATTPVPAAKAGAVQTRAAQIRTGSSTVCAGCHHDGRSGLTPPGHPPIAGRFGSGTAAATSNAGTGAVSGGVAKAAIGNAPGWTGGGISIPKGRAVKPKRGRAESGQHEGRTHD